jgi:hypothetical protein
VLARQHLGLSDEQVGLRRTIEAVRDDEQHWLAQLSEGLLYLHIRAAVTLVDETSRPRSTSGTPLSCPNAPCSISTKPLTDVDILVDEQYASVKEPVQAR